MSLPTEQIREIEARITQDVQNRKDDKKNKQTQRELQYKEVEHRIINEYPHGITEAKLKKGFTQIIPYECKTCKEYKVLPYDFINAGVKRMDVENCKICTSILYKSVRKCREQMNIICECGMVYYGSEDNTYHHNASLSHIKRMKLVINGKYYKRAQLIELAKQYKIPYYKNKNNDELVDNLRILMV